MSRDYIPPGAEAYLEVRVSETESVLVDNIRRLAEEPTPERAAWVAWAARRWQRALADLQALRDELARREEWAA